MISCYQISVILHQNLVKSIIVMTCLGERLAPDSKPNSVLALPVELFFFFFFKQIPIPGSLGNVSQFAEWFLLFFYHECFEILLSAFSESIEINRFILLFCSYNTG